VSFISFHPRRKKWALTTTPIILMANALVSMVPAVSSK